MAHSMADWVIRFHRANWQDYVQATVLGDGMALVAYELACALAQRNRKHRVAAVLSELQMNYAVRPMPPC
jgi:hypothetical protein